MNARAFIIAFFAAVAVAAAGAAGYLFLIKGKKGEIEATKAPDPASFEGEDVEDALAVENPPAENATVEGQETGDALGVEGDPWLDPESVEGEEIQGSGDFVEGEEPFDDVYAAPPEGGTGGGNAGRVEDPIDAAELPQPESPPEGAAAEPPPQ